MGVEVKNKYLLHKIFIILIKFMPTIHLVGMLINNTLYHYEVCFVASYIIDFVLGYPMSYLIVYFVSSYIFQFCIWYRIILVALSINVSLAFIDSIHKFPCGDMALLTTYYIIAALAVLIIVIIHVKNNGKTKTNKRDTSTNNR